MPPQPGRRQREAQAERCLPPKGSDRPQQGQGEGRGGRVAPPDPAGTCPPHLDDLLLLLLVRLLAAPRRLLLLLGGHGGEGGAASALTRGLSGPRGRDGAAAAGEAQRVPLGKAGGRGAGWEGRALEAGRRARAQLSPGRQRAAGRRPGAPADVMGGGGPGRASEEVGEGGGATATQRPPQLNPPPLARGQPPFGGQGGVPQWELWPVPLTSGRWMELRLPPAWCKPAGC